MTKVRKSLTSLLWSFLLFYTHTSIAQLSTHVVDPHNRAQMVAEITYLYQGQLSINADKLLSFLEQPVFEHYSPSVDAPKPRIDFANDESIGFSWPDLEVDEYAIRWINFQTGETGELKTTATESTIHDLPNAPYLFSFQARNASFGSADFIIIEDKPIMAHLTDNCQCKETQELVGPLSFIEGYVPDGAYILNWPQIYFHNLYRIEVEALSPMAVSSSVFLTVKGANGTASRIGFVEDCMQNMAFDGPFVFTQFAEANPDNFMQFSFAEALKMQLLNPNFSGSVRLFQCTNFRPGPTIRSKEEMATDEMMSEPKLNVFPNPSWDWIKLEFDLEQAAWVQLSLTNSLGQQLHLSKQQQVAGSHQQVIDLRTYPSGIYDLNLLIRSEAKIYRMNRRVLKVVDQ